MIDFPNSPSVGQTFTPAGSNQTWLWDGTKWVVAGASGGSSIYLPITGGTLTGPLTAQAPGSVLDNVTIGGVTPKPGSFTALQATSLNGGPFGTRNKIINGDFRVDQRLFASTGGGTLLGGYFTDRWNYGQSQASKFTASTALGSMGALGNGGWVSFGVNSTATLAAADNFTCTQIIEGLSCTDLGWGTASAKPVTISFAFYSSLTGTHSASLCSKAGARSYAFTWNNPTANTWTPVQVTIPGDTAGTWAIDNTQGIYLRFNLGCGSNYLGPAGAWSGSNFVGASGAVQPVATVAGATFVVGNVQLEAGSIATPFERRLYGQELDLCRRYYQRCTDGGFWAAGYVSAAANVVVLNQSLNPPMRAAPTGTVIGTWSVTNCGQPLFPTAATKTAMSLYGAVPAAGQWTCACPANNGFDLLAEL